MKLHRMCEVFITTLVAGWLFSGCLAQAQNPQCPTRPAGDSTNACASTAFVQAAVTGIIVPATNVTFTQTGTGAVQITLDAYLRAKMVTPEMFGALCNGTGDDGPAIQRAIDSDAAAVRVLLSPRCTYRVVTPIIIAKNTVYIEGAGDSNSVIQFAPTANGTLISVTRGATSTFLGAIRNVAIFSADTTFTKTAISLSDVKAYELSNISISGSNVWTGGTGSIGIRTFGRDTTVFKKLRINAQKPIVISLNPNVYLSSDHFHFSDIELTAGAFPVITVETGAVLTNLTFDGYQAWNAGTHGFFAEDTTSLNNWFNLRFSNVRTEQGTDPTAYSFYLSPNTGNLLKSVTIDNPNFDQLRKGVFARRTTNLTISNAKADCSTATEVYNIDSTDDAFDIYNSHWEAACTVVIAGLSQKIRFPNPTGTSANAPPTASYQSNTSATRFDATLAPSVGVSGATSGALTQSAVDAGGNRTAVWGTNSGTPVVSATSPLTITAATGDLTITAIPNSALAAMAANTVKGNATSGSATPTDLAMPSCSTAASALLWTTNTGFSCNTSITAAAVPVGGITGLGTGVATWLATPSSANLLAAVTDETGTGALVFANTPTLITPVLGVATGTSLALGGALTSGQVLTVTGNSGKTGYLRVGSATAPANTTAGDLTAVKLNLGNTAFTTDQFVNMAGTSTGTSGTNPFALLHNTIAPGATSTTLSRVFHVRNTVPTTEAGDFATIVGAYSETFFRGTGNVTALSGYSTIPLVQDGTAQNFATISSVVGYDTSISFNTGNTATGTVSAAYGFRLTTPSYGSKTITGQAGLSFAALTGATNNTYVLLGTNTIPTGNFGIYNTSTNQNYLAGGLSVGTTTDPGTGGLILNGATITFTNLATDATHTDRTVCQDTTSKSLFFGSGALGVCLGTSGRQFKTDFQPMKAGLAEIAKLKLWNYRYKEGHGDDGAHRQYGPTAQDVEDVLPDLVRHNEKGEVINYDYGSLLFIGLRAIQQLKADNDNLRQEIRMIKRRTK